MKRYLHLLIVAAIISAPFIAIAATPQDDIYKAIQTDMRAKNYSGAVTKAQQALQIAGLSAKDKVRFLNIAADASMEESPAQYDRAKVLYEQIIADKDISNRDKINALNNLADAYIQTLAGQYLDQMNLAPANEIMARALKLPNLTPSDQALAFTNTGNLYARQYRYDDAIATYQKILTLDVSDAIKKKAWKMIADTNADNGNADDAIKIYRKQNFDVVDLYIKLGKNNEAITEIMKILEDVSASDKGRWAAFGKLPYFDRVSTNYPSLIRSNTVGIQQMSQKYLPAFIATDASRALVLLPSFKSTPAFRNSFYVRGLANPAYLAWAAPIILQAPKLSDKDYALVKTKYVNALAGINDVKQIISETAPMQNDVRLNAKTKFWASLVNSIFVKKNFDANKMVEAEKTLPEKEKAQAVLDAAQTVLQAGADKPARALYASYEGLFAHGPQATIKSTFVDNAPYDVGSWITSPLLKDKSSTAKMDRPYGDNLAFLNLTDSSTSGRNVDTSDKKDSGDTDTNLYAASDAKGIHLFFDLHDSHAQEVLDGLASGGSIEMYIAPGKDQAYYTFIPRFPQGQIDTGAGSFVTMYPNAGWRLPSTEDSTLVTNTHRTANGFGLSLFLSWDLFYDKLPSNGDKWQLEAIRWSRSGGFSFGGSQSVHNRSSWGDIIFSGLTKENRNAIKRNIIFKALTKYTAAKKLTGVAGNWADPELGDPAFYQEEVEPLLKRLDQYAAKVNNDMTDADVELIYKEAVPDWMEINYKISALRANYLEEKVMR